MGLALLLCGTVLASALALSRIFGFDAGGGAGLLAGGLNASAAIGTAGDAIARLPLEPATTQALSTSLAVAFAVTYLVGLLTEIFTLTTVGPWLMRADLAAECRKLESEMGVGGGDVGVSGYQGVALRAYAVPARLDGRTVAELERSFAPARVFVERLRTPDGIVDPTPGTVVRTGHVLALSGRLATLADAANPLTGTEVDDPDLLDIPMSTVDVTVAAKEVAGRTLGEIAESVGREERQPGRLRPAAPAWRQAGPDRPPHRRGAGRRRHAGRPGGALSARRARSSAARSRPRAAPTS